MTDNIILTGKEIETLKEIYEQCRCNVVLSQGENYGIGNCVFVQTQEVYNKGSQVYIDITDYEAKRQ